MRRTLFSAGHQRAISHARLGSTPTDRPTDPNDRHHEGSGIRRETRAMLSPPCLPPRHDHAPDTGDTTPPPTRHPAPATTPCRPPADPAAPAREHASQSLEIRSAIFLQFAPFQKYWPSAPWSLPSRHIQGGGSRTSAAPTGSNGRHGLRMPTPPGHTPRRPPLHTPQRECMHGGLAYRQIF